MKITLTSQRLAALAAAAWALSPINAHAGHVYGGIIDTNGTSGLQAGDALAFIDTLTSSPAYGSAITGSSLGVQIMPLVTGGGAQNGLYLTSNISFTALSDGRAFSSTSPSYAYFAASPFAAQPGSLIQLEIQNVTGPDGGTFSFWDNEVSTTSPVTSYQVNTGLTLGTGIWNLTDLALTVGDGVTPSPTGVNNPPTDPYGHIHGRSFTVDMPGEYTVRYILHDASGIQADSAPFVVSYSAVPEPGTIALLAGAGVASLLLFRRRKAGVKKIVLSAIVALNTGLAQAHEHYAAGYLDMNGDNIADAGDKLQLVTAPPDGMVFHMLLQPAGQRYAGYYVIEDELPRTLYPNDPFTFIALSDGQTELDGPQHAATGSDIWMEITSVTGPDGGSLGFWNIDPDSGIAWSYTHTTPTVSFFTNEPTGGYKFEISEPLTNPVAPTEDPFGHIHERAFTADMSGTYTVGFMLYDLGTNGPDGGPIEQPSQTYYFTFVAVPEPGTLALLATALGAGGILWWRRRRIPAPLGARSAKPR